jgi:hypothetical protein
MSPMAGGKKIIAAFFIAAVLIYYGWLLGTNLCTVAGGSDSSGYLNFARRLRNGPLVEPVKTVEALGLSEEFRPLFQPIGFTRGPRSQTIAPAYPPGLPLHMAALAAILGWKIGPFLVSPLAALAGLFLIYGLARQLGLSRPLSLVGGCVLAAFPAYLFIAVQPLSDVLASFWGMSAVLAALLSRKRAGWAWAAGAAFGLGVLVRPSNMLILFPLLWALPSKPKIFLKFFFGGFFFGFVQFFFNRVLYGSVFTTGYREEAAGAFAIRNFPTLFLFFGRWLSRMLTPLVPLAWPALIADRNVPRRDRLLLVFWFAPFLIFYGLYQPFESWTFVRFFLPALPALILSALLLLRDGTNYALEKIRAARFRDSKTREILAWIPRVMAGLLVVLVVHAEIGQVKKLKLLDVDEFESVYEQSCLAVKGRLPETSILVSGQLSGALTFYTHFPICLWDSLRPQSFFLLQQKAALRGWGLYALLFPSEEKEFQNFAPGPWEKIESYRFVSFWQYKPK